MAKNFQKYLHMSIKCSTFVAEMVTKQPPYMVFY